ncbi:MAG: hypothetical protein RL588_1315 [Pseudomonadota bacterium]
MSDPAYTPADRETFAARYLTAEGRLGRRGFLVSGLILLGVAVLYDAVSAGPLQWITGWLAWPLLVWIGACLLARRLHDRGRNGWIAAVILAALVAVWPQPSGFLDFPFVLVLVWAAVELGVMTGEPGVNRYGPPPRG